jgi:hypothetical protein
MVLKLLEESVTSTSTCNCGLKHLTQLIIINFSAFEHNWSSRQCVHSAASVLLFTFSRRPSTGLRNCPV